ncbi:MAG: hypothetical protein V1723_01190 [Candidatus Uhrbacteria bacterium]
MNSKFRIFPIGQGLLETTVAVSVIVTGLAAVFGLVMSNARANDAAALRFNATQLAREGVEVVRMLRDSNWLAGDAWDVGITAPSQDRPATIAVFRPSDGSWSLNYVPYDFDQEAAMIVRVHGENETTFFTQSVAPVDATMVTPYRRLILLYPICASGAVLSSKSGDVCYSDYPKVGIDVRSVVQWSDRNGTHELTAEEHLYDWR